MTKDDDGGNSGSSSSSEGPPIFSGQRVSKGKRRKRDSGDNGSEGD